MTKVILAGHSKTAQILQAYLSKDTRYDVVGCTVDDAYVGQNACTDLPCWGLSTLSEIPQAQDASIIMAIGYKRCNSVRQRVYEQLQAIGFPILTYIHPDAKIYTDQPIGKGSVVLASIIDPFVRIGENTMVWAHVTIAHHSRVGHHCWVASGTVISGGAEIGNNSFLGVNSTIVNDVKIGHTNIIGAGALISKSTKDNSVHLARSAEPLRFSATDYDMHFGI